MEINQYNLHAKTYSSITAVIIPCILTYVYLMDMEVSLWKDWSTITKIIGIFIPLAVVYSAIGFAAKELFRTTSKLCFQNVLYSEDETKMPTTEFLLWRTQFMPQSMKQQVRDKLLNEENYKMLTKEEELQDEREARLNIVGAVRIIRQRTWGHEVLTQYNYQYGYWRNLLGGLVWAILYVGAMFVLNFYCPHISNSWIYSGIAFNILLGIVSFFALRNNGKVYASHLFPIYLTYTKQSK